MQKREKCVVVLSCDNCNKVTHNGRIVLDRETKQDMYLCDYCQVILG